MLGATSTALYAWHRNHLLRSPKGIHLQVPGRRGPSNMDLDLLGVCERSQLVPHTVDLVRLAAHKRIMILMRISRSPASRPSHNLFKQPPNHVYPACAGVWGL